MRRGLALCLLGAGALGACAAPSSSAPPLTPASAAVTPEQQRARITDFTLLEQEQLEWMAAIDPRIAMRVGHAPPAEVIAKVGTMGVLAEDPDARIRGDSLDLFAFRARAKILDHLARTVKSFGEALPEEGLVGSALARPKLERELLERLVDEEVARTNDEARLGDASADLVRGMVATWEPPKSPQEVPDRDLWASKHLLEIRDSLRGPDVGLSPTDLDSALYPLERLLSPGEFPKGAGALAQVRTTMDSDMRVVPKLGPPDRLAREVAKHLGVAVDVASLPKRLEALRAKLRGLAVAALEASGAERGAVEGRARELLMVERPCPVVADSPLRAMGPPSERAPICGMLRAMTEEEKPAAVLVALHDDVLFSLSAVESAPPPRTELLSHPADEVVDSLHRMARERPVVALGVGLAAELIYGGSSPQDRTRAWVALGEAPLDVVARELER
jgi:hypothetical protein